MNLWKRAEKFFSIKNNFDIRFFRSLKKERFANLILNVIASNFGWVSEKLLPLSIFIETTKGCNFDCIFCLGGKDPKAFMNFEIYKRILDIFDSSLFVFPYVQAEPLLNKEIYTMLNYSVSKGFITNLSSNFSVVDPWKLVITGVDEVSASVDSADPEKFRALRRNGNLDKVIDNIRKTIEIKAKLKVRYPVISMTTIVMKQKEDELDQILNLGLSLGIKKFYLQTLIFRNGTEISPTSIPDIEAVRRAKMMKRKYKNRAKVYVISYYDFENGDEIYKYCFWAYISLVIGIDGDVYPCCMLFDQKDKSFGNIFEDFDGTMKKRREFIKRFRIYPPEFCKNCNFYKKGL